MSPPILLYYGFERKPRGGSRDR